MVDVPMPKLSMNMSEGLLTTWLVEDGATVEAGEDLVEVESEKASAVVDAPTGGVVHHAAPEGASIPVGEAVATIESPEAVADVDEGVDASDPADAAGSRVRATPSARRAAREQALDVETVATELGLDRVNAADVDAYADQTATAEPQTPQPSGIRASPAARHAAREADISLEPLDGTGPDGAVVLADVTSTGPTAGTMSREAPIRDRTPLRGTRGVIAERMLKSWQSIPQVTVDRTIDIRRLLETRAALEAQLAVDVSLNDLLLAGVASTLERHPEFNATVEADHHVRYDRIDVAIAVDTDRGLLAPVLRDVTGHTFAELVQARASLVERTQNGTIDGNDLTGGTFTISNLGPLGVDTFTPLVNPPQVGILGISAHRREPIEGPDGDVVFADVLTASLTFDHRAVDGADAARFLETLAEVLSNPLAAIV